MRAVDYLAAVILCAALAVTAQAEELPSFTPRDYAVIVTSAGEEIPGEIVKITEDGTVVFSHSGKRTVFQKRDYRDLLKPISKKQIIEKRGEILLRDKKKDRSLDIRRTIKFGQEEGELEAARALAIDAMRLYNDDLLLAEMAIELLEGQKDHLDVLIKIAEEGLKENSKWIPGYRAKAEALKLQNKDDELFSWVTERWLPQKETDQQANRYLADLASKRGQRELAISAYRKLWRYHKDMDAGARYAEFCLLIGDLDKADEAAADLERAGKHASIVNGVKGCIALRQGELGKARQALQQAGSVGGKFGKIITYNLGLAQYRSGQRKEAIATWSGVDLPAAELALAIAKGKPIKSPNFKQSTLQDLAQEHNICVQLANKRYGDVTKHLKIANPRHVFLGQVAKVLAENGSDASMRALQLTTTAESKHWQIYGHLIQGRMKEVQRLLDELPQDDGYAAVVRVYVAFAAGDADRARNLYQAVATAKQVPKAYVAKLAAEFDAENDEMRHFDFSEWNDGVNLRPGWSKQQDGTGVQVRVSNGRLVIAGTQTSAPDPVSRAWCLQAPDKVREVLADLDLSGIGSATAGIEILDEKRRNGLAYAILPNQKFAWRQLTETTWGAWNELESGISGSQVRLQLQYNHHNRRMMAVVDGSNRLGIGRNLAFNTQRVCVGLFGVAEPGEEWKLSAKSLTIQLKPLEGSFAR